MVSYPRITVVTPSYNQGRYISDTIESVLSQNYPDLEYIVVDGGSSDGSVDVIRGYGDRLAWWISEADRGQADAINKGFARSTGEILAFLNSDDFYFPDALHRVAGAFMDHPNVGVVWGRGEFVSETGEPRRSVGDRFDPRTIIDGGFAPLPQPAIFIRRCVYEKIGGLDTDLHYTLDAEFFWRAFSNFDALFIPYTLAALRTQPSSKSVVHGPRFAQEILRNAEKLIANPSAYPRFQIEPGWVRSAAYLNGARYLYNNCRYREAFVWMTRSLRLSRRYVRTILFRDMPRLFLHMLVRKSAYNLASGLMQRGRGIVTGQYPRTDRVPRRSDAH